MWCTFLVKRSQTEGEKEVLQQIIRRIVGRTLVYRKEMPRVISPQYTCTYLLRTCYPPVKDLRPEGNCRYESLARTPRRLLRPVKRGSRARDNTWVRFLLARRPPTSTAERPQIRKALDLITLYIQRGIFSIVPPLHRGVNPSLIPSDSIKVNLFTGDK